METLMREAKNLYFASEDGAVRGPEGIVVRCSAAVQAQVWAELLNTDLACGEMIHCLIRENDGPVPEECMERIMLHLLDAYLNSLEVQLRTKADIQS